MGDIIMKKLLLIALISVPSISQAMPQSPTWADLNQPNETHQQGYISSDDEIFTTQPKAALLEFPRLDLNETSFRESLARTIPQTVTQAMQQEQQAKEAIQDLTSRIFTALAAKNSNTMRLRAISIKVVAHRIEPDWISMYFQSNLDREQMPFDYALQEGIKNHANKDILNTALAIAQNLYNALPNKQQDELKEISNWREITQHNPDVAAAVGKYINTTPVAIAQQASMTPTNPLQVEAAEATQPVKPEIKNKAVETSSCWCC